MLEDGRFLVKESGVWKKGVVAESYVCQLAPWSRIIERLKLIVPSTASRHSADRKHRHQGQHSCDHDKAATKCYRRCFLYGFSGEEPSGGRQSNDSGTHQKPSKYCTKFVQPSELSDASQR